MARRTGRSGRAVRAVHDAPGCVPGVAAEMSDENVSEPCSGTGKAALLVAMYFRWSKTLKSAPQ